MDPSDLEGELDVELDVFSGRPNPHWTLGPKQLFPDLIDDLAEAEPAGTPSQPPDLGYPASSFAAPRW
jgi:hypothetical protein